MNNTALTILGMIVAFLTALLAPIITEAVKSHYQHKTKLYNLRVALYKEMWNNCFSLFSCLRTESRDIEYLQKHTLRTECYKLALLNDVTLFYELKEADSINRLQGIYIGQVMALPTNAAENIESRLLHLAENYIDYFSLQLTRAISTKRFLTRS